ncbi:hypothetical protein ESY86_15760 [Subsaximicrobium wynnwilliamsii]|uniref:Uncharacterized protein n=1 Tax=Subsaximicrobium wynnwilliamsii TaxID=291179 RepID=A0A5C6ZFX4_9FLAO|nr:hypothetical protein [Subsaximicrobium wynnwilliamsii]TXD82121.1 hypothetical protein ESY87_15350 [Subsaximicrobium wynnwilliamsii]TXD87766.1 hypothetical protein ESY86_15760 [Subsaximicrobium wynnwilliamsii]TXE01577.1 hypothetical protein ESY88_15340 [Subsaximicrobium wynnwilliamsii]
MKLFKKTLLILAIFAGFTFQSCSSDDDSGSQNDDTYIRFTAGGEDFNYADPATAGSQNLTINGQNGNDNTVSTYSSVSIWFPLQITTGTYDFSGDFFQDGDYKLNLESTALNLDGWSETGSVIITAISSDYIEGTFTGTIEGVAITNGEFRAFNL